MFINFSKNLIPRLATLLVFFGRSLFVFVLRGKRRRGLCVLAAAIFLGAAHHSLSSMLAHSSFLKCQASAATASCHGYLLGLNLKFGVAFAAQRPFQVKSG